MSLRAGKWVAASGRNDLQPARKPRLRRCAQSIGVESNTVPLISTNAARGSPSISKMDRYSAVGVARHDPDRRQNNAIVEPQLDHWHLIPAMFAAVGKCTELQ